MSSDKEMVPGMGFLSDDLAQEEAEASRSNSQPGVHGNYRTTHETKVR